MRQKFVSALRNSGISEDNESVAVQLIIVENEGRIDLSLDKETAKVGPTGDVETKEEESLEVKDLDVDGLETIRDTVNIWIKSDSKATLFETISNIEGEYSVTQSQSGRFGNSTFNTPNRVGKEKSDHTFDKLHFSVGKSSIEFQFEENDDFKTFSIPSAETVKNGVPQDITNADLLNKTLYDFFNIRLSSDESVEEPEPAEPESHAVSQVQRILDRFGEVARYLDGRGRERPPLKMEDEYDVQYLLHGLLGTYFDDIRAETSTDRHSAVNPRIDFLLEQHAIGIEVKRASDSMTPKRIRSELAEDKEQYRKDSNIETLFCFIYDPDSQFKNPMEFETDFASSTDNLTTKLVITK